MYEHCFLNLDSSLRAKLQDTNTSLVGFSGETNKPLGKIELNVCFGDRGLYRRTTMNFCVVRSPSPYNMILGRTGLKGLKAIPSTIHSMMKFPTPRGIATLTARPTAVLECRRLEEKQTTRNTEVPQEAEISGNTEEILIHPAYPEQLVVIGTEFSQECRKHG